MKRKELLKQYNQKINTNFIVRYEKEGNKIRVHYSNGFIKSLPNTTDNELYIVHEMKKQISDLEKLIAECDGRGTTYEILTWLSVCGLGQNAAYVSLVPDYKPLYSAILVGVSGALYCGSLLKQTDYEDMERKFKKMKCFIEKEKDLNSDCIPVQIKFGKNGLPINGYHRMTMNDALGYSLDQLNTMADENRDKEYELKRKAC